MKAALVLSLAIAGLSAGLGMSPVALAYDVPQYSSSTSISGTSSRSNWSLWLGASQSAQKRVQVQMAIPEDAVKEDRSYKNTPSFSLELQNRLQPNLSLGVALESQSNISNGSAPKQTLLGGYFLPRLHTSGRSFQFWAGAGIGVFNIHQEHMLKDEGNVDRSNMTALALSPRVGVDLALSSTIALGLYGGHTWMSGLMQDTVTYNGDAIPFQMGQTIRYYQYGLRLGIQF